MGLVYRAQAWCIECRGSAEAAPKKVAKAKPAKQVAARVSKPKEATAAYEFEVMDDDDYAAWEAEQLNPKSVTPTPSLEDATATTNGETAPVEVAVDTESVSVGFNLGQLTTDLAQTRVLYKQVFPKDNQARPWKTMADRLVKKLGNELLSEDAALKLMGL